MNNIKKAISNNKFLTIIILIVLAFVIILGILLKAFIPSGYEYGDRLKGIEKVEISDKDISKIEKELEKDIDVLNASINIRGRLINVVLKIKSTASAKDMKNFSEERLELFEEEEKKYYDIQFYLYSEDDKKEGYPTIGYKHKTSENLVWSNN